MTKKKLRSPQIIITGSHTTKPKQTNGRWMPISADSIGKMVTTPDTETEKAMGIIWRNIEALAKENKVLRSICDNLQDQMRVMFDDKQNQLNAMKLRVNKLHDRIDEFD